MNSPMISRLILKDWRLNRLLISLAIAIGLAALVLVRYGAETARLFGAVWFFVALMVLGSMLPATTIVNERKKQNLAFLMSLPVSSVLYTTAKVVSTFTMFLAPWLTLLIGAFVLITTRNVLPHGAIPMFCILALLPVIGFCVICGMALVGESEGWGIAGTLICNSSYGVVWYFFARVPSLSANLSGRVAVWNPAVRNVLFSELGLIAVLVGLTYFFQSRKRDFV
jgi:ABC-2 type transport system permease protein